MLTQLDTRVGGLSLASLKDCHRIRRLRCDLMENRTISAPVEPSFHKLSNILVAYI